MAGPVLHTRSRAGSGGRFQGFDVGLASTLDADSRGQQAKTGGLVSSARPARIAGAIGERG